MTRQLEAVREARRVVEQHSAVSAERVHDLVASVAAGMLGASSTLRNDVGDSFKQMIVMRKDLNMRKGKMVAQGAHASMKATLEYMDHPFVQGWLDGPFTKVVVGVASLDELLGIYVHAESLDIPCSLILDAGKTEFNGVPTYTAVGVGPAPANYTSAITGHLKLL